jgi:hypothetical protein
VLTFFGNCAAADDGVFVLQAGGCGDQGHGISFENINKIGLYRFMVLAF